MANAKKFLHQKARFLKMYFFDIVGIVITGVKDTRSSYNPYHRHRSSILNSKFFCPKSKRRSCLIIGIKCTPFYKIEKIFQRVNKNVMATAGLRDIYNENAWRPRGVASFISYCKLYYVVSLQCFSATEYRKNRLGSGRPNSTRHIRIGQKHNIRRKICS